MGKENTGLATGDDAQTSADAARNLGRFVTCAAMYPAGHPLLAEAAERAIECTSDSPLALRVLPDELAVRSHSVNLGDRETGRLHEDLRTVGISRIRFDSTITVDDLYQFAVGLLKAKAEAAKSAGFVSIDVSKYLPGSIWVELRGFGARSTNETSAMARVMGALEGVTPGDDVELMSNAVDVIVPRIVELFDADSELGAATMAELSIGLDEVLDVCATALRAGVEDLLSSGGPLGDLSTLIQATEKAISVSDDPEAMEIMIEVLRQAADEIASGGGFDSDVEETLDDGFDLTMEEMRQALAELQQSAEPLDESARSAELAETLSIALQLCLRLPVDQALPGIGAKLARVHGTKWSARETNILENGVVQLLEANDAKLIDDALPALLESLRADGTDLLPRVLANLARTASQFGKERLLWPHVVNQLLLGLRRDDEKLSSGRDASDVSQLVGVFDPANESGLMLRLARLEAVREHRIVAGVLALKVPELYPVLRARLHSKDGRRFGDRVFRALHNRPMPWLGAHAFQCSTSCSSKVRDLILEMLATDGRFETSASATQLAATIMVESIQALPEGRREEDWVPKTLRALGQLDPLDEDGLLRRVMKERKFFRRVWPKDCRLAAEQGLRPSGGQS